MNNDLINNQCTPFPQKNPKILNYFTTHLYHIRWRLAFARPQQDALNNRQRQEPFIKLFWQAMRRPLDGFRELGVEVGLAKLDLAGRVWILVVTPHAVARVEPTHQPDQVEPRRADHA